LVGVLLWYVAEAGGVLVTLAIVGSPDKIRGLPLALFGVVRMVLATGGIAIAMRLANRRLGSLGLTTVNWRADVAIGAAIGVIWPLLEFLVLIPNTGGAARSDVVASRALIGDSPWGLLGVIIAGWIGGGFGEELFNRGHIIYTLRNLLGNKRWAIVVAVIISALYFGIGHLYQGWVGMVDTGAFGLIMALLYVWRGRLTAPIIAHGLNNMLLFIGLYFLY
jgi:hypothetical protein